MKISPQQVKEALSDPSVFVQLSGETQNIIKAAEILSASTEPAPKKKGCKSCKSGKKSLPITFYKQLYKENREVFDNYYAKRNL
jgi:hypothetical protein